MRALILASLAASGAQVHAAGDGAAAVREQGRALFHGERHFERAARVGGVALPSDASPCARCHGAGGEGTNEGGVTAPSLAGTAGAAGHAGGSVERWLEAASRGRGGDGRRLQAAMPHYEWSAGERTALAAFVAALGTDAEPVRGVRPGALVLGTLLPLSGPRAAVGQAVLQGLRGHFEEVNRAGGVYGRRIDLQAIDWPGERAGAPQGDLPSIDLREALRGRDMLALVGSFVGDLAPAQQQALQSLRLPMIANLGPALRSPAVASATAIDWSSALLPSVSAQLQAGAAAFDDGCAAIGTPLLVLHASVPGLRAAVEAALAGRALRFVDALPAHAGAPRHVLALHDAAHVRALRESLEARDCLWTLAMFSGGAGSGRAAELSTLPGQAALPLPDGRAAELWPALGRLSAQLAVEALARAGRSVQPEHLARVLNALPAFEPVAGVRLELSRQRRHALPVLNHWSPP